MVVLNDDPSCTYSYYQENIKPKNNVATDTAKSELLQGQHGYCICKICGYEYVGEHCRKISSARPASMA